MAVEQDGIDVSFRAAADLSAGQFRLVVVEDDGQVNFGAGDMQETERLISYQGGGLGAVHHVIGHAGYLGCGRFDRPPGRKRLNAHDLPRHFNC